MNQITLAQAKKLALLSQRLPAKSITGTAYDATKTVFEQLGYLQIDTISVVQRAHHHVLWSRNTHYHPSHLDQMVTERFAFEYWAHAASYLPMRDFRYTLPRKHALKTDQQRHWFVKDHNLMNRVLQRITDEGPLMAKDFESSTKKLGVWGSKPTKQALENLYMQGDLMITERKNFHKVYDLTERVLPNDVDSSMPSDEEYCRYLIKGYLRANGFGTAAEMTYLLKGKKTQVTETLSQMCEEGSLMLLKIQEQHYYASPTVLDALNQRLNRRRAAILSPFDNLLIQRSRAINIFDFDYKLECYVPQDKRQYGYFCLPILWNSELVARADCKADRLNGQLKVHKLFLERKVAECSEFEDAFDDELSRFSAFNQCDNYAIDKVIESRN
jgi:uncharacterized protein YcaQ